MYIINTEQVGPPNTASVQVRDRHFRWAIDLRTQRPRHNHSPYERTFDPPPARESRETRVARMANGTQRQALRPIREFPESFYRLVTEFPFQTGIHTRISIRTSPALQLSRRIVEFHASQTCTRLAHEMLSR